MQEHDKVTIKVPCSSANVGPFYDVGCLGLKEPSLQVTYEKTDEWGLNIKIAEGSVTPPPNRILGAAANSALTKLLNERSQETGHRITIADNGYPVGGLGRSGAEAVGAIMAYCVYYGISLTRGEVIRYSAKGEPGEHKDNVAGSTNGRFNIIATPAFSGQVVVRAIDTPPDLGIAIGFSSHQKTSGTEGMRKVLQRAVPSQTFVEQSGRIAMITAAMVSGNTDLLLDFIGGDLFHEPRRANIKGYGNFKARAFTKLKRELYKETGIVINVSGAGPNMQFLYSKEKYPDGVVDVLSNTAVPWFVGKGIQMAVKDMEIAEGGAYDYAVQAYDYH